VIDFPKAFLAWNNFRVARYPGARAEPAARSKKFGLEAGSLDKSNPLSPIWRHTTCRL